ncbi:hypothetical protein MDR57_003664 [Salmonella enterica]|nr:hypothetical protein [Salmonella enterica]
MKSKSTNHYPTELRERSVRMILNTMVKMTQNQMPSAPIHRCAQCATL